MNFIGSVTNNQLRIHDRNGLTDAIRELNGCDVELTIKKAGRRSSRHNRYYWGVVLANIRERMKQDGTHVTVEQLHQYFKTLFIPVTIPDANGEAITLGGESRKLNRKEFADYVDAVVMWAWEKLDIAIEAPNEQTTLKLSA